MSTLDQWTSDIISSDVRSRGDALFQLHSRLERGRLSDCKKDSITKLMTELCLLRDSNPKIALVTLQCLRLLMKLHADIFAPVENMAFDAFFCRFGDTKANIRTAAVVNMLHLAGNIGYAPCIDKLTSNTNFVANKSAKVKEHVMYTLLLFQQVFGAEVIIEHSMVISQVSALLNDGVISVRQLAIDVIANFHNYGGDELLYDLEQRGIRIGIIEKIQESVLTGNCSQALSPLGLDEEALNALNSIAHMQRPLSATMRIGAATLPITSSKQMESIEANRRDDPVDLRAIQPQQRLAQTISGTNIATTATSGIANTGTSRRPGGLHRTAPVNIQAVRNAVSAAQECVYLPQSYVNLLKEGPLPAGIRLYSEKELIRHFEKIQQNFNNLEDWTMRMQALAALQGLALGEAMEFESEFLLQLRNSIDLLVAQVVDLRSVLSKEASRTVAILCVRMGPAFAPLADQLVPALLRLTNLKIKAISSAADRAIRIILSTGCNGFPRLLPVLVEHATSKSAQLRRIALEYLCLCSCLWRVEPLEKALASLRTAIRTGLADADGTVRRVARHLFWVLQSNVAFRKAMDALFDGTFFPLMFCLSKIILFIILHSEVALLSYV